MRSGSWLTALAVLAITLSGCADTPDQEQVMDTVPDEVEYLGDLLNVVVESTMNFTDNVVDDAIYYGDGLYEPSMEVSDTGVIYVTGHTTGVDTTGAPVWMSKDDGDTWSQLPFVGPAALPNQVHGATPPITDEIWLVAGDDGALYGADITAFAFPVNAWGDDGAEHTYYNPNAYDRAEATTSGTASETNPCFAAASLNDRPWAAYGGDKLLLVNNPGGGPMQLAVMDTPLALPVGIGGPVVGPEWNLCASSGGGIPGIPDMRADHFFAVPQTDGESFFIVTGYADDIFDTQQIEVAKFTNKAASSIGNGGRVAFDQNGTMFVSIMNNTKDDVGRFILASSTNDGGNFSVRTFEFDHPVSNLHMDGNMYGPGAVIGWAEVTDAGTDWYVGHAFIGEDGAPVIENVNLMVKGGPAASAHVQSFEAGPDGRAYLVLDHGALLPGETPLSVVVQQDGPTLPVYVEAVSIEVSEG